MTGHAVCPLFSACRETLTSPGTSAYILHGGKLNERDSTALRLDHDRERAASLRPPGLTECEVRNAKCGVAPASCRHSGNHRGSLPRRIQSPISRPGHRRQETAPANSPKGVTVSTAATAGGGGRKAHSSPSARVSGCVGMGRIAPARSETPSGCRNPARPP